MASPSNWTKTQVDTGTFKHTWKNEEAGVNLSVLETESSLDAELVANPCYTVMGQAGDYDFVIGESIPSEELARKLAVNWMRNNENPVHLRRGGEP